MTKQDLLNTGVFDDNQYLEKYVELINNNLSTKYEKFKTQKHHIIPKYYYRKNNLEVDDSVNNVVNLMYSDHVLAHVFIGLATSDEEFKRKNYFAAQHVLGNVNYLKNAEYLTEKSIIENKEEYQKLYEESRRWWSKNCNLHDPNVMSREQRSLNGKQNKGRKHIFKDGVRKFVKSEDYQSYIDLGWSDLNFNESMHKGRRHMYKGEHQVFAKPEDIDKLLTDGYVFGDKPGSNSHFRVSVKNIDTGELYDSIAEASLSTGVSQSTIRKSLNNNIKVKGGRWVYAKDRTV